MICDGIACCHREERNDEAIHDRSGSLGCFASLAMTIVDSIVNHRALTRCGVAPCIKWLAPSLNRSAHLLLRRRDRNRNRGHRPGRFVEEGLPLLVRAVEGVAVDMAFNA